MVSKSADKKRGPKYHFSEAERAHMATLSEEYFLAKRGAQRDMSNFWDKVTHQVIAISAKMRREPQGQLVGDEVLRFPGEKTQDTTFSAADTEAGASEEGDNTEAEATEEGDDTEEGVIDCGSVDEASASSESFKVLRKKISQFMRGMFALQLTTSNVHSNTPLADILSNQKTAAPRRSSAFQLYTRMYYTSRVKPTFIPFFAALRRAYDDAGTASVDSAEGHAENDIRAPIEVAERTKMTHTFWERETEEFRNQIKASADDEYNHALAAWEQDKEVPVTPQQYHHQLEHIALYLGPMADAIAKQLGGPCTISVVGPIPEAQGDIQLRSVHANWKGSLESFTWPKYDPIGYAAAQTSIVGFGRAVFTKEECARRALPETKPEDPVADAVDLAGAGRLDEAIITPGPVLGSTSVVLPPIVVTPAVTTFAATSAALFAPAPLNPTTPAINLHSRVADDAPKLGQLEEDSDEAFSAWNLDRYRGESPGPVDSWELSVIDDYHGDTPDPVGSFGMSTDGTADLNEHKDEQQQSSSQNLPLHCSLPSTGSEDIPMGFGPNPPRFRPRAGRATPTASEHIPVNSSEPRPDTVHPSTAAFEMHPTPNLGDAIHPAATTAEHIRASSPPKAKAPVLGPAVIQLATTAAAATRPTPNPPRPRTGTTTASERICAPSPPKAKAPVLGPAVIPLATTTVAATRPTPNPPRPRTGTTTASERIRALSPPKANAPGLSSATIQLAATAAAAMRPMSDSPSPRPGTMLSLPRQKYVAAYPPLRSTPDIMRWPGIMRQGWSWLHEGAEEWGIDWANAVELYMRYAVIYNFPQNGANAFPPMVNIRPPQIGEWLGMKRKWVDMPIPNIDAFAAVWSAWWAALQPTERVQPDGHLLPPSYDTNWACLRKPGANGIQLLIVTLRWWGKASNASAVWRMAVADVAATLCCVTDGIAGMRPEIDGVVAVAAPAAAAPRSKRKMSVDPSLEVTGKRVRKERVRSY